MLEILHNSDHKSNSYYAEQCRIFPLKSELTRPALTLILCFNERPERPVILPYWSIGIAINCYFSAENRS